MSFFRSKPDVSPPLKRVWRISQSNPLGEWIEVVPQGVAKPVSTLPQGPGPAANNALPEVSYGSWVTSSYDLLDGSDVIEDPDTLPGELLDDLFPQWAQAGTRPDK